MKLYNKQDFIHWESNWKHKDGRKITCEGDYKKGEVDFKEIDCNLTMCMAGFKRITSRKLFII